MQRSSQVTMSCYAQRRWYMVLSLCTCNVLQTLQGRGCRRESPLGTGGVSPERPASVMACTLFSVNVGHSVCGRYLQVSTITTPRYTFFCSCDVVLVRRQHQPAAEISPWTTWAQPASRSLAAKKRITPEAQAQPVPHPACPLTSHVTHKSRTGSNACRTCWRQGWRWRRACTLAPPRPCACVAGPRLRAW